MSMLYYFDERIGKIGERCVDLHLFEGNDIEKLHTLLKEKYVPENWRDIVQQFSKELMVETVIIQEYITKPLLFKKHYKFDLRMYVLTASTNPTVVFYHSGKMRICGVKYTEDFSENAKWGHITNCKIQREHENFEHTKQSIDGQEMLSDWEGFVKFMHELCVEEDHFGIEWYEDKKTKKEQGTLTVEDVGELIDIKCKRIIRDLCDSVGRLNDKESIELRRPCQFTFHGIDVIMDDSGNMWLLEVNRCASISLVGFENIREMTKRMLAEMVDICFEIRNIKKSGRVFDQDTPLSSQKCWQRVPLTYLQKEPFSIVDEKFCRCILVHLIYIYSLSITLYYFVTLS
ncbi:Tubulin--tyrosine ligase [Reticulomyxa filosa]|uniref:Tubulin--tyrosine ligase n=1 Tax=Reticulomyxa filosa TaxID=46433 RepID=X6M115_RETFI|nr:Tubulin--tyrosine ligase [Reticulomyxa filosa]|eukprot:ETO07296.1 Tubulin--tyrosine ligase [Reticulomyxa filosa]